MTRVEADAVRPRVEYLAPDAADLETVQAIMQDSFPSSTAINIAEELGRQVARIWVARVDTAHSRPMPIGVLVGWHVTDELHILHVATAREFRRRGVGLALVRKAIEYAQASRVRLAVLEVRCGNQPAIGLYRRLGFSAMGLRRGYYTDNGEDALEMMLVFDTETGCILPQHDEVGL